jgi:hypothetical protein
MALVLADRVRDTTTTTGTGTVTLSGTAPTGYQTFGSAIGNANTTYYTINAGSQWEVGIGTYSSTGPTLARTTILASSSAGAAVDFAVGTKDVFVTYPAEKSVNYDASDNVGIGTTSPGVKLDVAGVVRSTGTSVGRATLEPGAASNSGYAGFYNAAGTRVGYVGFANDSSGIFLINSEVATNAMTFSTAATERMRITSAGDVGIGTSSPGFKLDVSGDAHASGSIFTGSDANGWGRFVNSGGALYVQAGSLNSGGATAQPIIFTNMYGGSERMRIDSSGNVGIGAAAPQGKLDVQSRSSGTVTTGLVLDNRVANSVGTGIDLRFYVNDGGDARYAAVRSTQNISGNYADLRFLVSNSTTPAEAMRISSGGYVAIGNSNAAPKFSVTLGTGFSWGGGWGAGSAVFGGNGATSGAGSGGLGISYDDTDGASLGAIIPGVAWKAIRLFSDNIQFCTNGATERMRITSGGIVQVNTTTTPSFGSPKLIVDGPISGKGFVTINSSTATTIAEGAGFLIVVRNRTHGGTAVVQYENATTPIIIATSGGTTFQTGTPSGSAQIQLTNRSGNLGIAALASGDRNNAELSVTIIQAYT